MMDYTYETDDLVVAGAIGMARAMSCNLYHPVAMVDWKTGVIQYASERAVEYLCRNCGVKMEQNNMVSQLLAIAQDSWIKKVLPYIDSAEDMMIGYGLDFCECEYLALELEGISESHRRVYYLMKITPLRLDECAFALVTISLSSNKAKGRIGLRFDKDGDCFFLWNRMTKHWESVEVVKLTNSESHLMRLMSNGYKQEELAEMLFCSMNTVRSHKKNILKKLDASNFVEAMMNATNGRII